MTQTIHNLGSNANIVPDARAAPSRELKLLLPLHILVSLQSLKLLRSHSIRDTVESALTNYFTQHPVDMAATPWDQPIAA